MSENQRLRGGCSCGRNRYSIFLPPDEINNASVYFDNSSDDRRSQAGPLAAWLRVPLMWYQSHTTSYFPDETHSSIRRTFTPPRAPHCKRSFCGFCGTPLTYWSEEPPGEEEYMSVSVGSLSGQDQSALEDLELLPREPEDTEEVDEELGPSETAVAQSSAPSSVAARGATGFADSPFSVSHRSGTTGGIPWFEEMIQGSRLGRVAKGRRGMGRSRDGSTQVQWEVSEWHDEPGTTFLGSSFMSSTSASMSASASMSTSTQSRRTRMSGKRKTPELG